MLAGFDRELPLSVQEASVLAAATCGATVNLAMFTRCKQIQLRPKHADSSTTYPYCSYMYMLQLHVHIHSRCKTLTTGKGVKYGRFNLIKVYEA